MALGNYDNTSKLEFGVKWFSEEPGMASVCSVADHATGPAHIEFHRCDGSSLFLDLPDPGLSLRLDLHQSNWEGSHWTMKATLSVTVHGQLRDSTN
jgi:hypothetical protein